MSCAPTGAPEPLTTHAPLHQLIATPSRYQAEQTRTEGYLAASDNAGAVFTTPKAAADFDPSRSIRVRPSSVIEAASNLDGAYVRVSGTFEEERDRSGPWIGTLAVAGAEEIRRRAPAEAPTRMR